MKSKTVLSFAMALSLAAGFCAYPELSKIVQRTSMNAEALESVTVTGWRFRYDDTHCEIIGATEDIQGAVEIPSVISVNGTDLPVTKIDDSFYYGSTTARKQITELTIPESITFIGRSSFWSAVSLKSVTINAKITMLNGSTFNGCTNLETVKLPEGLITIDEYCFKDNISLTAINLPSSLTTIGNNAFGNCTELQSIRIPGSVKEIPVYAFSGCKKLTTVELESGVKTIDSYAFSDCESLENIVFPETVEKIDSAVVLDGCKKLKSITIANPDLEMPNFRGTEEQPLTICGKEGSTAQTYCETYGEERFVQFELMPEKPKPVVSSVFGDINNDQEVDLTDAQLVLRYYTLQMGSKNPDWVELIKASRRS